MRSRALGWRACMSAMLAFVLTLMLAGCATQTRSLLEGAAPGLPTRVELESVPFHAQERFQCGPAALAMTLNAAGIPTLPDALISQVYVPQREGSLPPEMLAAARRNGAFGARIPPRLDALLAEIAAGHPVVVLQNLSLPVFPLWHYAVAIGYDIPGESIILRSGVTERLVMPMSTFENTWKRSGYWAMVALPPDMLPVSLDEAAIVDTLIAYEQTVDAPKARIAYEQALRRWPENFTLHIGLGNAAYASRDFQTSASAFRRASEMRPDDAAALNNLANVLAEMGDLELAAATAERAIALGGPWRESAMATLRAIRSRQGR